MTGLSVVLASALALVALWLRAARRGLVAARDAADATWAAIDVHLRERHALVPALVAAVQAETAAEAQALARLAAVREQAVAATTPWERADAERRLASGITTVGMLAERHPGLGAAAAFVDLQARLADIE